MDPLSLLRDFTKSGKPVKLENDTFYFDKISFPAKAVTAWRSKAGNFYTLDTLWFALQHADKRFAVYKELCKDYSAVSILDREDVISYLQGKINSHPSISVIVPVPETAKPQETKNDVPTAEPTSMELDDAFFDEEKRWLAQYLERPKASGTESEGSQQLKTMRFVQAEGVATREILKRERQIRTRLNALQSSKKHFTSVINTVTKLRKKDAQMKEAQKEAEKRKSQTYDRYSQVDDDNFWKERLKDSAHEEFGIDTRGTFAGRLPQDLSVLQQPQVAKTTPEPAKSSPMSLTPAAKKRKLDPNTGIPIIIVPSALTAFISLFNVKDFLEHGIFVPTMDKKKEGAKKEPLTVIYREKGGQRVPYHVIDTVPAKEPFDWERVVAIFSDGRAWQFKDWSPPWNDPVNIFSKVPGFYAHYEDDKLPDNIKSWDVKVLTLSKISTKKHLASTATSQFWDIVDTHCSLKKVSLNF